MVVAVVGGADIRVALALLHATVVLDVGGFDESALPLQHQLLARQPDERVWLSR